MLTLPDLPYAQDALEPHISARTFEFHYGKHHQAYVTNGNNLIKDTPFADMSIEEMIRKSFKENMKVFNNAAQVWNHTFYWNSMKPGGGGTPSGKIGEKIAADFGSYDEFKSQFHAAGAGQFGSGWAWLVLSGGKLKVYGTPNAENPLTGSDVPLLVTDVWEHAYYLDYQNKRPDYLTTFIDELINWDFAEKNLAEAG